MLNNNIPDNTNTPQENSSYNVQQVSNNSFSPTQINDSGGHSHPIYSDNAYSSQNNYKYPIYNMQEINPYSYNQVYKKPPKPITKGVLSIILTLTVLVSSVLGFTGGYLSNRLNTDTKDGLTINKIYSDSENSTKNTTDTSAIVQKTADSVVEISTESVVTGSFAQQYIRQGAGSGVIISEDGYIITNQHVIDGASTIKVSLRDQTKYEAKLIGSDEDSDIALIKIEATGLSAATFGDSSKLAVGDYVVAIGNPLGTLGGTVTDGIISALAREITIENRKMTLLQTNAQISPGNSGGGLFGENGELIGIVNAKDSATEVEGIAFAIPINNVLDILSDLKTYGYVTGKVDLKMEFIDITTEEAAFYYGVNRTGCYILSVGNNSLAEKSGFTSGDLVTKINNKDIKTSSDIKELLKSCEVGDNITFTIYRRGKSIELSLTLEEYIPPISQNILN